MLIIVLILTAINTIAMAGFVAWLWLATKEAGRWRVGR